MANLLFPDWLITVLLVILLLYVSYTSMRKAVKLHFTEHRAQQGRGHSRSSSCSQPGLSKAQSSPQKQSLGVGSVAQRFEESQTAGTAAGSSEGSEQRLLLSSCPKDQQGRRGLAEHAASSEAALQPGSDVEQGDAGAQGTAGSQVCCSLELQCCQLGQSRQSRAADWQAMGLGQAPGSLPSELWHQSGRVSPSCHSSPSCSAPQRSQSETGRLPRPGNLACSMDEQGTAAVHERRAILADEESAPLIPPSQAVQPSCQGAQQGCAGKGHLSIMLQSHHA